MHPNTKDITGRRFGRWTVVGYEGKSYWLCRCDCGAERRVFTGALTGHASVSRSCGCARGEAVSAARTTHGLTRSAEYKTWAGIKRRCLNARDRSFHAYGAAGVRICRRWADSFGAFLADMGPKPTPRHTIERIDNRRGYAPGNCRWATVTEQNRNKRTNRPLTLTGRTQTMGEWAREIGVHHSLIQYRLRAGWSVERTLTTPPRLGRNQFTA